MKSIKLIAAASTLLLGILTGCIKEDSLIFSEAPDALLTDAPEELQQQDYFLPPCNLHIISVRETYQPLANATCDTVWVDIDCMEGDKKTHSFIYVAPNDPACPVNKGLTQSQD